jgi:hypothetical protein
MVGAYPSIGGNWASFGANGGLTAWGNLQYHLLPFIEQKNLWALSKLSYGKGNYYDGDTVPVEKSAVKTYQNPSDPSETSSGLDPHGYGVGGFAANAQVFGVVGPTGSLIAMGSGSTGYNGVARIPGTFTDGTSNTILFTEKYAQCNLTLAPGKTWNGTSWDATWCDTLSSSYHLSCPFFASDYYGTYPSAIGLSSMFQVTPTPWSGSACDPGRAQAPRSAGILTLLGDASVRLVSSGVSATTWWNACTPGDGQVLGSDW